MPKKFPWYAQLTGIDFDQITFNESVQLKLMI